MGGKSWPMISTGAKNPVKKKSSWTSKKNN